MGAKVKSVIFGDTLQLSFAENRITKSFRTVEHTHFENSSLTDCHFRLKIKRLVENLLIPRDSRIGSQWIVCSIHDSQNEYAPPSENVLASF